MKRFFAILMTFFLVISGLPIQSANAAAFNPVTQTEGDKTLGLRFWEDQKPDIGFYINAGNRYLLETVKEPSMGTASGEWSVMDLLRGAYTGADYLNYLPDNYFEDYYDRINEFVILKDGVLDNNKSTEWSRLTLAMSSLGKDIRSIGTPGTFIKTKQAKVEADGSYAMAHYSNSQGLGVVEVHNNQFTLEDPTGINFEYTNRSNKLVTTYGIIPPGTYTIQDDYTLINEKGEQASVLFDEKASGAVYKTHTLTKMPEDSVVIVDKPYDFVEQLSKSYTFAQKQGINGPIWVLIALNTGGYELYSEKELQSRGITIPNETNIVKNGKKVKYPLSDFNTEGRMIDHILQLEVTTTAGRKGGWALSGKVPDPDITMMAIQGLAPYYFDEAKFKKAFEETIDLSTVDTTSTDTSTVKLYDVESESFKEKYIEFKKAVERAVVAMAEDQLPTGSFKSMGAATSESIAQVIVGLTALGIDPLSDNVYLPTIDQTVSFIKEGGEYDGVWSNNMIDALTAFWAMTSGSAPEVGGFKHVSAGGGNGGSAGTTVNAMATDQSIYGFIAYDRFVKKQNTLYDMSDMINGEYKTMKAKEHAYTYMVDNEEFQRGTFSPYEVLTIPEPPAKDGFNAVWTTHADGTGAVYKAGERLSTPDQPITLYAQYVVPYEISYELGEGQFITENNEIYNPADRSLTLPTVKDVKLEGHAFLGWYEAADFSGKKISVIQSDSETKFTLYAKWISYEQLVLDTIAAIENIPSEAQLTLEDENVVIVATELYSLLSQEVAANVSNYAKLKRAQDLLKIKKVEKQIDALPDTINLTHKDIVEEASNTFNALAATLQVEVKNAEKLEAAKITIADLITEISDREAANALRQRIEALPAKIESKDITEIKAVRKAYDELSEKQKSYLKAEIAKLESIEKELEKFLKDQAATQMKEAIAKLPDLEKLTVNDKEIVLTAYSLYNALPEQLKQEIDVQKMNAAVAKLIDVQIEALPVTIKAEDEEIIKELQNLYDETSLDIQQLVKNYKVLQQKIKDLEDLPKLTKANAVIAKINMIPTTVTATAKAMITDARNAYDALTVEEKAFVTNLDKLTGAETQLQFIEAQETLDIMVINAQILALPSTISLSNKDTVTNVYNAYQAMSLTAKMKVTNASKLLSAYATITALENNSKQVIQALQASINALPENVTADYKVVVEDIRKKYDALTIDQKQVITLTKLIKAEQQLALLDEKEDNNSADSSDEKVTENETSVEIVVPTKDNELFSTISQQLINETSKQQIDIKTNDGFTIGLPKNALKAFKSPVHVEALFSMVNSKPSIEVNFYKEVDNKLKPSNMNASFTVKIPKNKVLTPTASLTNIAVSNGVILSYSKEGDYKPVPHVYKNGEFIVTMNEPGTLIYSTDVVSFNDIQNHYSKKEIEYLASRYVIRGYTEQSFRPNEKITRAQFASLLSRALGLKPNKETKFTDIHKSPYKNDIQALAETGILAGKTNTTFAPNESLTREDAAIVMARVLEYMDIEAKGSIVHYIDKEQINEKYLKQIGLLNRLEIMSGFTDGSFKPKESLTRGQLAIILQRTLVIADVM